MTFYKRAKCAHRYFINRYNQSIKYLKDVTFLGFLKIYIFNLPLSYVKYMKVSLFN
jgi:hypothetical protein